MKLTRRGFLRVAVLGASTSVAALSLGPFAVRNVEAEEASAEWHLQVTDLAGNVSDYTLGQISAMPETTVNADLNCVDSEVAEGDWGGVTLGYLLQGAGLDSDVSSVVFKAKDGYAVTIQMPQALNPNVMIAYELNGSPLPETLRLVLPGASGDIWINQITSITMGSSEAQAVPPASAPANATATTQTQQESAQPQFQPPAPNGSTGAPAVTTPSNACHPTQESSKAPASNANRLEIPVAIVSEIASAATIALMAVGYVTRRFERASDDRRKQWWQPDRGPREGALN